MALSSAAPLRPLPAEVTDLEAFPGPTTRPGRRRHPRIPAHRLNSENDVFGKDRADGIPKRIADRVAMTVAAWASEALAAVVAVLDKLLGVVPGPAGVGQEDRHQHADADRAGQVRPERPRSRREPDRDRGEHRESPRGDQLTPGADPSPRSYSGCSVPSLTAADAGK